MNKHRDTRHLVVGLDVGTSKIVCIVAEMDDTGGFQILGMGNQPSYGLRRGVVVDIEQTVEAIQRALEEAELMANCKIREVVVGIAGSHITSFNSTGMVAVKDSEITQGDMIRVIEAAKTYKIPTDQQLLHTIAQEYIVDGQDDVKAPLGMSGVRLEVKVHMVTGSVTAVQNIVKCVRRCGVEVSQIMLQPLASALAVLTQDEKDLGVCLIDIGGGTTDMAVFAGGAIRHTAVIPLAGDQVNNDIAMALRTPPRDAEDTKIKHGCANKQLADPRDMIEVPGIGDHPPRTLSRQTLAEFIEPRIEELYGFVKEELHRSGYEALLSSGIVITGGSALMPGMAELGEEIFHAPVRVGWPRYTGAYADVVRNPRYATCLGLVMEGIRQYSEGGTRLSGNSLKDVLARMKNWFKANF